MDNKTNMVLASVGNTIRQERKTKIDNMHQEIFYWKHKGKDGNNNYVKAENLSDLHLIRIKKLIRTFSPQSSTMGHSPTAWIEKIEQILAQRRREDLVFVKWLAGMGGNNPFRDAAKEDVREVEHQLKTKRYELTHIY